MVANYEALSSRHCTISGVDTWSTSKQSLARCCSSCLVNGTSEANTVGGDIPRMKLTRGPLEIVKSYRHDFCPFYWLAR